VEVLLLELLAGHPGIPRHFGSCIDRDTLLATSVQEMAQVPLRRSSDLSRLAESQADPVEAAKTLAVSSLSLFQYVVEERGLRLEDLHWGEMFDVNASGAKGAYEDDDISQFAVDSEEELNLVLIDLDKMTVNHDLEVFWYVQEHMGKYVAERILPALIPLLPRLEKIVQLMTFEKVEFRPRSFKCLKEWAEKHVVGPVHLGSSKESDVLLPSCMCEDKTEKKRGTMPCELAEEYRK